jgi:MFS family permease
MDHAARHSMSTPNVSAEDPGFQWWRLLNRYQWFVLTVAALGWLLDCMDQQLFNLARVPAMKDLLRDTLPPGSTPQQLSSLVSEHAGYATAIFLLGWATGGLIFGVLGDRIGRAKTMLITILLYSGCTGLSAFATAFWDFALYRFLTGLGVGGEFAVGVALVAEVMPDRARPYALSLLQALSTVGNIGAAVTSMSLGHLEETGVLGNLGGWPAWRWMFVVGAVPALLVVVVRRKLREPDRWVQLKQSQTAEEAKKLGDYGELFGNPNWRLPASIAGVLLVTGILLAFLGPKAWSAVEIFPGFSQLKLVVTGFAVAALAAGIWCVFGGGGDTTYRGRAVAGLMLALAGVIGVWGIAFFSFDLVRSVLAKKFELEGITGTALAGKLTFWAGITSMIQNVGAFLGIYTFGIVAQRMGRKPAFAIALVFAMFSVAGTFWFLRDFADLWMVFVMGFGTLALFGGYAVYFPELFPTRLRSTGTSFCYNVGRFVAASGPAALGLLTGTIFKDTPEPLRYAGVTMCSIYVIGLLALPFAPETKGKPLPEEDRGVAH